MGLFNKKEQHIPRLPDLPTLPKIPQAPSMDKQNFSPKFLPDIDMPSQNIHELPSFPTDNFSEKFSQNSIKSAIEGENELNLSKEEMLEEEINELDDPFMAPQKIKNFSQKEFKPSQEFITTKETTHSEINEPVFVRIDKFEESLKIFKRTKNKLSEIEDLLKKTKEIKSKEDEELSLWENELRKLQEQIGKVDKDIFSKVK